MDITRFTIDEHGTARLQTSKGVLMLDAADLHIMKRGMIKLTKSQTVGRLSFYASLWTAEKKRKRIGSVARIIMDAPAGMYVDHINHDTLDNRRINLRICTFTENARNNIGHCTRKCSKYKGVAFQGKYVREAMSKPWRAYTRVGGKRIWIGYYATQEEAAEAYNAYASKEFGAFACLNVIEQPSTASTNVA